MCVKLFFLVFLHALFHEALAVENYTQISLGVTPWCPTALYRVEGTPAGWGVFPV